MCFWPSTEWWEFHNLTFSAPAVAFCFTHTHTHTRTFTNTQPLSPYYLSQVFLYRAWSLITIATNDCACFRALFTRVSQGRAVCKSTGMHCASVSHEGLHLFPSPRRTHLAPSFNTQFTKHNSQISAKQERVGDLIQSIRHLLSKHCLQYPQ